MKTYPTRIVTAVNLAVCSNGHVEGSNPRPETQVLADCGHWVWLDANYCGRCGADLKASGFIFMQDGN